MRLALMHVLNVLKGDKFELRATQFQDYANSFKRRLLWCLIYFLIYRNDIYVKESSTHKIYDTIVFLNTSTGWKIIFITGSHYSSVHKKRKLNIL